MIQSYYNINNAKTLRYINGCIWSTYEGATHPSVPSYHADHAYSRWIRES